MSSSNKSNKRTSSSSSTTSLSSFSTSSTSQHPSSSSATTTPISALPHGTPTNTNTTSITASTSGSGQNKKKYQHHLFQQLDHLWIRRYYAHYDDNDEGARDDDDQGTTIETQAEDQSDENVGEQEYEQRQEHEEREDDDDNEERRLITVLEDIIALIAPSTDHEAMRIDTLRKLCAWLQRNHVDIARMDFMRKSSNGSSGGGNDGNDDGGGNAEILARISVLPEQLWANTRDFLLQRRSMDKKLLAVHVINDVILKKQVTRSDAPKREGIKQEDFLREEPLAIEDFHDQRWRPMLEDMFHAMRDSGKELDVALRVKSLRLISCNGHIVEPFGPRSLVDMLMEMLLLRSRSLQERLHCSVLVFHIVKHSFASLAAETQLLVNIIESMARLIWADLSQDLSSTALSVYEVIISDVVAGESLPPGAFVPICSTLCHSVNVDHLSDRSVAAMRSLLATPVFGERTFQVLLDIMTHSNHVALYRGAVFFVGTAKWGPNRIETIQDSSSVVLFGMHKVLSSQDINIAHEVMLNIHRLLRKYGPGLHTEWGMIVQIVLQLEPFVNTSPPTAMPRLQQSPRSVSSTSHTPSSASGPASPKKRSSAKSLTTIDHIIRDVIDIVLQLHEEKNFHGNLSDLFEIIRTFKETCTEATCIRAMNHMQEFLHPALTKWSLTLKQIFTSFFENEQRQPLREQVLDLLAKFLWKYGHVLGEESLGEALLYAYRATTNTDNNPEVQTRAIALVIDALKELTLSDSKFTQFAHLLVKTASSENLDISIQLFVVAGLIEILSDKFNKLPCSETVTTFNCLALILGHESPIVREKVIHTFKELQANHLYQIGIGELISPYIKCHSLHLIRTISHTLPIPNLVNALLDRIKVEENRHVFNLLLQTMERFLHNVYILKDTPIVRLCTSICTTFQERINFVITRDSDEHHMESEKFTSHTHFESSKTFISVLRLLSGYSQDLGSHQKHLLTNSMILALHRALSITPSSSNETISASESDKESSSNRCGSTCSCAPVSNLSPGHQLVIACLENLNVLVAECCDILVESHHLQLIIHALEQLQQRASSIPEPIIMSVLELLHFMGVKCPAAKRSSIAQHCFNICLDYTDNDLFSHHVLLVSYRVVIMWFVRCTFIARQKLIKMCLPVLYERVRHNKCTMAEATIDFLIKYAYLSCEQDFTMTDQLRKLFDNHKYKAWSVGNSILTAQSGKYNYVILRFRRPTGTIAWTMKLLNTIHDDMLSKQSNSAEELDETLQLKTTLLNDDETISSSLGSTGTQENDDGMLSHHTAIHNNSSVSGEYPLTSVSFESALGVSLEHDRYHSIVKNGMPNLLNDNGEETFETDTTEYEPADVTFIDEEEQLLNTIGDDDSDDNAALTMVYNAKDANPKPSEKLLSPEIDPTMEEGTTSKQSSSDSKGNSEAKKLVHMSSYGIGEALPIKLGHGQVHQQQIDNQQQTDDQQLPVGQQPDRHIPSSPTTQYDIELDDGQKPRPQSAVPIKVDEQISLQSPSSHTPTKKLARQTSPNSTPMNNIAIQANPQSRNCSENESIASRRAISVNDIPILKLQDTMAESKKVKSVQRSPGTPSIGVQSRTQQRFRKSPERMRSVSIDHPPLKAKAIIPSGSTSARAIPGSKERMSINEKLHAGLEKLSMPFGSVGKSTGRRKTRRRVSSPIMKLPRSVSAGPSPFRLVDSSQSMKQQQQQQQQQEQQLQQQRQPQTQQEQSVIHPNFPYLFLRNWTFMSQEEPRGLTVETSLTRALHVLDLIPSFETSKFAVLFVAEGQTREEEILANTHGTPLYFKFLRELGEFISLNELDNAYSGGLDKSIDGQYALVYKDETIYVVFHVATMMPNIHAEGKLDHKKRHIGNDYVTIVFSESSQFAFNTRIITGQFNFVHIVVYPLRDGLNRVELFVREDVSLPKFGPLSRVQIVSDRALSATVRLTALHADLAIRAWRKSRGESISNWNERLRQINVIKSRHLTKTSPTARDDNDNGHNGQQMDDEADNLHSEMHDFFEF